MSIELHNIPAALTEDKVTNVVIEHSPGRCVFTRMDKCNIIKITITPHVDSPRRMYSFFLNLKELDTVFKNVDLEEVPFDAE